MQEPKATHPPGPNIPAHVQTGDWVFFNGETAGIWGGLYALEFVSQDGGTSSSVPITRNDPDVIYCQIRETFLGRYEVKGWFAKDSPIPPERRHFGFTTITQGK